ncbi:MAG: hypothetical protein R3F54_29030 [Alphaproteobacteria bacterium]
MAAKETESERFWMRLPKALSRQIESRARAEGLNKTEWVRNAISDALAPSSEIDFAITDTLRGIHARLDQLEARTFHENSAFLHLGLIALRETTYAHTAAVAAAALAGRTGTDAIREVISREAERQFKKIHDEVISDLTELREQARIKAGRQAVGDGDAT